MRTPDPRTLALFALVADRRERLSELAHTLKLAGGSHPHRSRVNRQKRQQGKKLRMAIRAIELKMIQCCDTLYGASYHG